MNLIVDASVAFKWLVKEDGSDAALKLIQAHNVAAPDFLLAECRNAILTSVRRGKLMAERAQHVERQLDALQIPTMLSTALLPHAFQIALEIRHPIYDCIYAAAAIAADRLLVTADRRFAARLAASSIGNERVMTLDAFTVES